jgi:hypothetical protein
MREIQNCRGDKFLIKVHACEDMFKEAVVSCETCPGCTVGVEEWKKTCLENNFLNWRPKWWKE